MKTLGGLIALLIAAELMYRLLFGAFFTPGQVVAWFDSANEKSRPFREEIKRDWDQRQHDRERQPVGYRISINLQDRTIQIHTPVGGSR